MQIQIMRALLHVISNRSPSLREFTASLLQQPCVRRSVACVCERRGRSGLSLELVASPLRKSLNAQITETCPLSALIVPEVPRRFRGARYNVVVSLVPGDYFTDRCR